MFNLRPKTFINNLALNLQVAAVQDLLTQKYIFVAIILQSKLEKEFRWSLQQDQVLVGDHQLH